MANDSETARRDGGEVTMPALTHKLAVAAIKEYTLVLDAMYRSASSDASRLTFDRQRRGMVDLVRMVEDCAAPHATGRETGVGGPNHG